MSRVHLNQLTDEDLMVMYQNGNDQAFQVIYSRHSGKVYGYLRTKVSDNELAGDLLQEVFMKIHRSKKLYDKSFPVLPWVFTITRNVMIDGLRKNKREHSVPNSDIDLIPAPMLEEPSVSTSSLAPALMKLPENQRQAIELRYMDEKTFEEIAQHLETSSENVRQLISRGIKSLKRAFGAKPGQEER